MKIRHLDLDVVTGILLWNDVQIALDLTDYLGIAPIGTTLELMSRDPKRLVLRETAPIVCGKCGDGSTLNCIECKTDVAIAREIVRTP